MFCTGLDGYCSAFAYEHKALLLGRWPTITRAHACLTDLLLCMLCLKAKGASAVLGGPVTAPILMTDTFGFSYLA